MRVRSFGIALLSLTWSIVPACNSPPAPVRTAEDKVEVVLPWLRDGISREDVLLRLGTPSREFEDGRILCFLLCRDARGDLVAAPRTFGWLDPGQASWEWVQYDLVLVFGPDGRLQRRSLIGQG